MRLNDLRPGETGVVRKVLANGPLGQRLIELGFFPGLSSKSFVALRSLTPLMLP